MGQGGGFVTRGRLLLGYGGNQTVTLVRDAGETLFGGDASVASNFIGVDAGASTRIIVNGTNTVGVLTLPNATLLSDVAMDGSCDPLVGVGDLSLDGLKPHVADTGLLNTRKSYTLVTCFCTLSGSFAETHLPDAWHVRYDRTAGTVTIYYSPRGTLVKLM